MKRNLNNNCLTRLAVILGVSIVAIPNVLAQQIPSPRDLQEETQRAEHQGKLQQVLNDRARYAAGIVQRWETDARASGKWDENYSTDLQNALMKLQPDNLLAAGEASSYEAMLRVVATGRPAPKILQEGAGITTAVLGSYNSDMVYTPVTPCRIVDTRKAGGPITASTTRDF